MTKLRATNWDAVITSAPLDKQAAIVRDGQSEGDAVSVSNSYTEQPPIRPYFDVPANDIRNQRFGRLRVIGLGERGERSKKAPAAWVCQCDCGRFALMTTKALRGRSDAQCGECDYVQRVQSGNVKSPERRALIKRARQARSSGIAEFDRSVHSHIDQMLAQFVREGVQREHVVSSISRWIQIEVQVRRRASQAQDNPSTDDGPRE